MAIGIEDPEYFEEPSIPRSPRILPAIFLALRRVRDEDGIT